MTTTSTATSTPTPRPASPNLKRPTVAWSVVAESAMAITKEACRDRRVDRLAANGRWLLKALAALGVGLRPPYVPPVSTTETNLSDRELAVLEGMSHGKSNADIGSDLYITEQTVKTHARRLFRKLGARDRAHAVALAIRQGLI